MDGKTKKKKNLWNFIDSLEGDKVVWMIVILLILFSIVTIFSSTPLLAISEKTSRMAIVGEKMLLSVVGMIIIIVCCAIPKIGFFRAISQLGYIASIIPLLLLFCVSMFVKNSDTVNLGLISLHKINRAWRTISVGGFQFHVFEFVKIAMVMYIAWAVNAYKNDNFLIANLLSEKYPIWKKPLVKKIAYIYFPLLSVCLCLLPGSFSSTVFIGGVLFATMLIGGVKIRELIPLICGVALLIAGGIGINACFKDHKPFTHLDSAVGRVFGPGKERMLEIMQETKPNSKEFQDALDNAKQPISAKIAIKEGKTFGKGPGKSTQRYVVSIMFEDYMYSFIVEEYGLLGGIIILILYISLLARGSIIVRNCDNQFAKTAVAGLVILITGQAMMHIVVNCDMVPHTGQTLPLISHGNTSFLMFSVAFGIILSISKMAKRKIELETAAADPLVDRTIDNEPSEQKSGSTESVTTDEELNNE